MPHPYCVYKWGLYYCPILIVYISEVYIIAPSLLFVFRFPRVEFASSSNDLENQIGQILKNGLEPTLLEVNDVSGGCGAFFKIKIVSSKFTGVCNAMLLLLLCLCVHVLFSWLQGIHCLNTYRKTDPSAASACERNAQATDSRNSWAHLGYFFTRSIFKGSSINLTIVI